MNKLQRPRSNKKEKASKRSCGVNGGKLKSYHKTGASCLVAANTCSSCRRKPFLHEKVVHCLFSMKRLFINHCYQLSGIFLINDDQSMQSMPNTAKEQPLASCTIMWIKLWKCHDWRAEFLLKYPQGPMKYHVGFFLRKRRVTLVEGHRIT